MPNKIMIVDDTKSVRDLLKHILAREKYEVAAASSGEEGLDVFRRFKPDLILLDVVMPNMNGYEVCKKIRSVSKFVKIIMVSTEIELNKRLRGYKIGVDDYIGKPFEQEELLAKVRIFLRLKSVEDELRELNDSLNDQVRVRTRQLLEAEKMAALGRHTAGILHNLNNPLGAIMGTAELLTLKYPDEKLIALQRKAASQMKRIIGSILTTSRLASSQKMVNLDMNAVIKDQVELLKTNPFFKKSIHLALNLNPLPSYLGVYAHFSQTFANLLKNATDSMYDSMERTLTISSEVKNGIIVIWISDTGQGIPKDGFEKIFNPFFTTKPHTSKDGGPTGTGLGLAYCAEMIKSYGGEITVESEPGKGATFAVRLPLGNTIPANS